MYPDVQEIEGGNSSFLSQKSFEEFSSNIPQGTDCLSNEHRQYLLNRHGTLDLNPIPAMDDADPYNWPLWKKITNLFLVAFHSMMATFTAASIQCAFVDIAEDLHVSIQRVSYLVALFIAIIGVAPLFWRPLANHYGRRPVLLVSLLCSLAGNVGCARSHSYGTMGLCRAITAFFISPAAAVGSAIVSETFFTRHRGQCLGVWAIMVTLGVPIAPLVFGFAVVRVGYRWIYWTLLIVNGVQLVAHLLLGSETLYIRISPSAGMRLPRPLKARYRWLPFMIRNMAPTPLTLWEFVQPLVFFVRPCVILPACAYAMIFLFGSILPAIEFPQIWPEKYGSNAEQVGLQYISMIIGSVLGEQIGGHLSDRWMWYRRRRSQDPQYYPAPEFRLWLSYIGIVLTVCGVVVFLVQIENTPPRWNVTPLVGAAIAAAGNQVVTTVYITYSVDCHTSEAASVGVLITLVRQIWGFIGPFWFPQMLENVGFRGSAGVCTALIVGVSVPLTVALQLWGHKWR